MTTSPVDIKHIYDTDNIARSKDDKGIVILTEKQKKLIDDLLVYMSEADAERVLIIKDRMKDLEHLARAIALFPSLLEQHDLPGGMRTPKTLVEMLIDNREAGDRTLLLPSKASLGKGFLVAKMHTFSSLSKQSTRIKAPASLSEELMTEAVTMMFSLLAEDVYLNLIADKTLSREIRRQWGYSLLMLWEYRTDDRIQVIAPILNEVWTARRKLAPAFGTMMGTSELLLISMQMDGQWLGFIKNKLSDPGVSQAMEEFLFGISYEQISQLRTILRTKGIAAIGRDEVADYLGTHIKTDAGLDYRDFYSLYTIRRDDARERARMKLQGPHKTLEDYFIQFVTEQNV
ncbi:hypothetical protein [Treponema socranskii]|uniref:hypothetical protein n=1 Tax=Treponema TaxID=157 RepID=UPI0028728C11|nr:hypothetical protein [Treponema socranskii]MDR9858118.1 hypothetical protein [Treponema socranskii]